MAAVIRPLVALALVGCLTPAPRDPPLRIEPRLVERGKDLFAVAVPAGYRRGSLFYVLDSSVLPTSNSHPRIGLVEAVEQQGHESGALRVVWYCTPSVGSALPAGGLPLEGVQPDTIVRVGKCWGRYEPSAPMGCAGPLFDLRLTLGHGDKVRDGDIFEVLGAAQMDEVNRTVLDFARLGFCTVQPSSLSMFSAICRLDARVPGSERFDRTACQRSGFVHVR